MVLQIHWMCCQLMVVLSTTTLFGYMGVGNKVGVNRGSSDTLDVLPADGCLIDNHIVWLHGGRQQGGG